MEPTKKLSRDELRLEIERILQQLISDVWAGMILRCVPEGPHIVAERIVRLAEEAFGRRL